MCIKSPPAPYSITSSKSLGWMNSMNGLAVNNTYSPRGCSVVARCLPGPIPQVAQSLPTQHPRGDASNYDRARNDCRKRRAIWRRLRAKRSSSAARDTATFARESVVERGEKYGDVRARIDGSRDNTIDKV